VGATIKDIARAAKVSTNTVSRALNNKPDVSPKTREKVLEIARKLNYSPNYLAKSLISGQTRTVGAIVTDNTNPFYARIIKGIEDTARARGYVMILCNSNENNADELEAIQVLQEKRVDGILMTPVQRDMRYLDLLRRFDKPIVFFNRHPDDAAVDYVINDNQLGARLATERLIAIGRRNLVYLSGPETISSVRERLEGCRAAMRTAGLSSDSLRVEPTDLMMEDGHRVMRRLIDAASPVDGVLAYSDLLAVGAMRAILEAGMRIPADVALVGYDDIEFAPMLEVPLTTVRQPRYRIGEQAANLLIDRLEGSRPEEPVRIVLKPELVLRSSA
jgi:LacI family transcriptional regulator